MSFDSDPSTPIPIIEAPIPHGLLLELAAACQEEMPSLQEPGVQCFTRMLAIRDVLFLGQGPVHVWTHESTRAWAALEVTSSEGVFYLSSSGRLASFGQTRQEALEHLGATMQQHTLEQPRLGSMRGILNMEGQERHERNMRPALERHGLGMHFSLKPGVEGADVDLEALKEELWQFSCHPYFARAIHRDLVEHGQRSTTTQFVLVRSFPDIVAAVAPLGIDLCRSWPKPYAGNSNNLQSDEPLPAPPRRFRA